MGTFRIFALHPKYGTWMKSNDVGGTQGTCIGNNKCMGDFGRKMGLGINCKRKLNIIFLGGEGVLKPTLEIKMWKWELVQEGVCLRCFVNRASHHRGMWDKIICWSSVWSYGQESWWPVTKNSCCLFFWYSVCVCVVEIMCCWPLRPVCPSVCLWYKVTAGLQNF